MGPTLRIVGWVSTGALTAGAVTFALLANKAAADLKTARNSYPVTIATLNHDSNLTTTYAIVADSLTAAAVLVGGITLIATLTSPASSPQTRGSAGGARVMLGPASARLEATF
jgi:hypothetical protein